MNLFNLFYIKNKDKILNNIYFFISLNDGINYSKDWELFIRKHIILLGCYSKIDRDFLKY